MERLVVIGGDAAGMTAAAQARRLKGPDELEIIAFERGSRTSYAACGLPYLVSGEVATPDRLVARTPEEFRAGGIDARVCHEVLSLDTEQRQVVVRSLDSGDEQHHGYDRLVIATGASGIRPPLPGIDTAGVFDLRTIDDAVAVGALLEGGARRAVVVGGGYIGVEVAEGLLRRGLEVSLVELLDQPMGATLDPDMGALVAGAMRDAGVDLHLGAAVRGFVQDGGRVTGVDLGERVLPADLVVLGLGVRPNVALAGGAGIALGDSGGIAVDAGMATSAPDVWAAGDCVESRHRITGAGVVIALGTHANKQGRVAGTNLAGGSATFGGVLGTAVTRFGSTEVGRTGLTEAEAARAGFDAVAAVTEGSSRARYFPGGETMAVKLVVDAPTGRLLGGQIVGGEASAKRIDVVATALWNEMTVEDFAGMDLAYAPPFSPVWDPVLLAAGRTAARR